MGSEGILRRLTAIRRKQQLTFESLMGEPVSELSLPFVVGVMGDFSGNSSEDLRPLQDRKFIEIDQDNFDYVIKRITPGLNLRVENCLKGDGSEFAVSLKFESLNDFRPIQVARQIEPLQKLLELRDRLLTCPTQEFQADIAVIDEILSKQLAAIIHTPGFQKLEGSWRGLQYLAFNLETSCLLKIKILNCTKSELLRALEKAAEFDQTHFWKKIYEFEFACPRGEPFGVLIGDYEFTNHPQDIDMLASISKIAAHAFCPFVGAAGPGLMELESWRDLALQSRHSYSFLKLVDTASFIKWNHFRKSEESKFVVLTMPRVLARLPYGKSVKPIEEFEFEEISLKADSSIPDTPEQYCWMNSGFVLAFLIARSFFFNGSCMAIRGIHTGGRIDGLPSRTFKNNEGEIDFNCPTEVGELGISDRFEHELTTLGIMPLCHPRNSDYAVYFSCQTSHLPRKSEDVDVTQHAAITSRLPCVMALSRFAHYLMVITKYRESAGEPRNASAIEAYLRAWLSRYVSPRSGLSKSDTVIYPLAVGEIEITACPASAGALRCVAWLQPWLPGEDLTGPVRIEFDLPFNGD